MAYRRLVGLATTILTLIAPIAFAADRAQGQAVGSVTGVGVSLDNAPVPSGTALYAGDIVSTNRGGQALVRLLSGASAAIGENSIVSFSTGASPSTASGNTSNRGAGRDHFPAETLDLTQGVLTVLSATERSTRVKVPQATVIVSGGRDFPAVCRIAALGPHAAVFADRGRVEIHGPGAPVVLGPGGSMRLEAGRPQGNASIAGTVVDSMPEEVVMHPAERVEVPLGLGQLVSVGDAVRTLLQGRVRIQLLGGPYLNAGPATTFKIESYSPDAQQTRIDLKRGHLRGEATAVSKAGASFEVRTPNAVINGPGATFLVAAGPKITEACVIDGAILVHGLGKSSGGIIKVAENQCTRVTSGREPTSPRESAGTMRHEMYLTTVVGTATAGPRLRRAPPLGVGAAAANGVAAVFAAVGFGLTQSAANNAESANSRLNSAANNANQATAEATKAISDAQAAGQAAVAAMQNLLHAFQAFAAQQASPSAP